MFNVVARKQKIKGLSMEDVMKWLCPNCETVNIVNPGNDSCNGCGYSKEYLFKDRADKFFRLESEIRKLEDQNFRMKNLCQANDLDIGDLDDPGDIYIPDTEKTSLKSILERKNIYKKASDYFGTSSQCMVAIEEFSELINELAKSLVGKNKRGIEGLVDEVADSMIMLEQLKFIYNIEDDVDQRMDYKLSRLENIIDGKVKHMHKKQGDN